MTKAIVTFLLAMICLCADAKPANARSDDLVQLSARSDLIANRCYDAAGSAGWEQTKCAFANQEQQARLVMRAFDAALGRSGPVARSRLAASQRSWSASVDRKCHRDEVFGPASIGSIATISGLMCLATERQIRIDWLERQDRRPTARRTHSRRIHNGNRHATAPRKF